LILKDLRHRGKTLVATKIVLKSKDLTSIALGLPDVARFHEVSRAGAPTKLNDIYEKLGGPVIVN